MLNMTTLNRLYYLCNFHGMRCKHERVSSIIHQQLNNKPKERYAFYNVKIKHCIYKND